MAYDFDGTNDYLESTDSALYGLVPPFSVAFWFYAHSTSGSHYLFSIGNGSGNSDEHYIYTSSTSLGCGSREGSSQNATASGTFSGSTWTHAAARFITHTNRRVYRDGGNEGTNAVLRTPSGLSRTRVAMRARSSGGGPYDGLVAELCVWDIDIGTEAIARMGAGWSPLHFRPESIVGYWPLIKNSQDYKGGVDWTEVHSPPAVNHVPGIIRRHPVGTNFTVAGAAPPAGIIPEIMHHRKQMQAA